MNAHSEAEADPQLSVVVVIVSDMAAPRAEASLLAGALDAHTDQQAPPSMEVIVPHISGVHGIEHLQADFPHVRFLPISDLTTYLGQGRGREYHDELRARGIA